MFRVALWDLNETLVDDGDAWDAARQANFRSRGVEPPPYSEYRAKLAECNNDYVGAYECFGVFFASAEELNVVYNREYLKRLDTIKLNPDTVFVLTELRSRGIPCGIISTQSAEPFNAALEKFPELRELCFATLHDVLDKAYAIRLMCGMRGAVPKQAVFVGDAQSDVRHAKYAGATAILFRNARNACEVINNPLPDIEIAALRDILSIIDHKAP